MINARPARHARSALTPILFLGAVLLTSVCQASVISVGSGAFPGGSPVLTFTGLADGLEVNGLSVGGVLFSYSLGNGNVFIDGGPGVTNNINPPNIVSTGANTGVLSITLPSLSNLFGYGYAILAETSVTNATTITLFNGATNVGTLSYNGVPDPTFTGGFAGIQSTIPFNIVQLTFNSVAASAFAVDNVTFATIPEPSPTWLILSGAAVLFLRLRVQQIFTSR